MKNVLILLIFVIFYLSKNDNVFAQTDSIKVEYKQESIDSSNFFQRRKYKYLEINLKDEKNLIKIGVEPSIIYEESKFRIKPHLVFEKKIHPEWSLIFEDVIEFSIDNMVMDYRSSDFNLIEHRTLTNTINFGTRYYYGMKKSIREKTSGNNFNSNYFEFTISGFPSITKYNRTYVYHLDQYTSEEVTRRGKELIFEPLLNVSWGIQRRLSNYTFVDAKLYTNFTPLPGLRSDSWRVGIDIIFGFGYSVKRK